MSVSAISEGRGTVWPKSGKEGMAVRLDRSVGRSPLPKGRGRLFIKGEKDASAGKTCSFRRGGVWSQPAVRAWEETRGGLPYFLSVKRGRRRVLTEDQRARVPGYYFHALGRGSTSECARRGNLCRGTLSRWVENVHNVVVFDPIEYGFELSESNPLPEIPLQDVERLCPVGGSLYTTYVRRFPGGFRRLPCG
ncbi:MAG: hypothetical protein OXF02_02335 [Simkaniaceae bacterium]|nr:hypothetical protein [Simkaniaceae bacterium]